MKINLLLLSAALVNAATATQPVNLGTTTYYTILAQSGISTTPHSSITGNIGVSPIAATAITGFGLALAPDGQSATATPAIVGGKVFAASYGGATATALTIAVGDMGIAYADAAGRANNDPDRINVGQGAIGGMILSPGVYTFQMGITIGTHTTVTFDAKGDKDAVFILQTTGNLLQAANTKVILDNEAQAENIFWQVSGNVVVGARAELVGVLLAKTDVTFMTQSSLNGRILAQTECVLQAATIGQGPAAASESEVSNERALATAKAEVIATTTDPLSGITTTKRTIITQTTIVTASETKRTTNTTRITTATFDSEDVTTSTVYEPLVVVDSAGSGAAAPAATAAAVAVEGRAPFLASATATATATSSGKGSATATANAASIAGSASTATSTATTTATRTTTEATAFSDATKTDGGTLPTAASTTTGTKAAYAEALATKTATSTATVTFTEA